MKTRKEILAEAKEAHDKLCNCDSRYVMSCSTMAQCIMDVFPRKEEADDQAS